MNQKNKSFFTYEDIYFDENNIGWMFSYDFNGLFFIKNDCISYVTSIKEYDFDSIRLYGAISGIRNKIVLAPTRADGIVIFDTASHEYDFVRLRDIDCDYDKNAKFFSIAKNGEYLYLIGHCYPAIIRINPLNKIIDYFYMEEFEGFKEWNGGEIFRKDYLIKQQKLYIPCAYTNQVLAFDFETNKGKFMDIGSEGMKYSGICSDGRNAWLSPIYGNRMLQWEIETGKYTEIELDGYDHRDGKMSYVGCIFFKDKIYAIPAYRNKLTILDLKRKRQNVFDVSENRYTTIAPIRCYHVRGDRLIFVSAYEGEHYGVITDVDGNYELKSIIIEGSLEVVKELFKTNVLNIPDFIEEKCFFDLKDFFITIQKNIKENGIFNDKGTIGKLIWNEII